MWSEKERTNAVNWWWYFSPFYLWKKEQSWLAGYYYCLHPKIWSWSSFVDFFFYRHWQAAPNLWTYTYFSTEYGSAIISRRTFEDISQLSLQK